MVRWHQPGLVTSLAALLVSFSGCPRPAEAVLPFYEEVYLREKPEPQEQPRENWDLERILEDDVDDPSVPPPPPDPAVAWRDWLAGVPSESVGKASRGSLKAARFLEMAGPGYLRKNEKAGYGTDETVALILWVAEEMFLRYPGTAPLVVGDLSDAEGGRLRPHSSHQNGRDVDLGYYFLGNPRLTQFRAAARDDLDTEKTWALLDLLLSTGQVQYFFIDRRLHESLYRQALSMGWSEEELRPLFEAPIGPAARTGVIRHVPGHLHHLHVRFRCPEDDGRCQ